MEGVLTLIGTTWVQDDRGVRRETSRSRDILCRIDSVTRSEFFEGGRNGLNPELQFTVFSGDYEGETVCQYEGKQYIPHVPRAGDGLHGALRGAEGRYQCLR